MQKQTIKRLLIIGLVLTALYYIVIRLLSNYHPFVVTFVVSLALAGLSVGYLYKNVVTKHLFG